MGGDAPFDFLVLSKHIYIFLYFPNIINMTRKKH
jgi:hypothetical protein